MIIEATAAVVVTATVTVIAGATSTVNLKLKNLEKYVKMSIVHLRPGDCYCLIPNDAMHFAHAQMEFRMN
jgi:hypothetical protein